MSARVDRRSFLVAGGSALVVGFSLAERARAQGPNRSSKQSAPVEVNAFVRIGADGVVTLVIAESEMGQGVLTALSMILAEELEIDLDSVHFEPAPADPKRFGRQLTGGSSSVREGYPTLRAAGAAARMMLIEAAAETWKVPAAECHAEQGAVIHERSKRRTGYGELAARTAKKKPPEDPPLKTRESFRLIGRSHRRLDARAKVTGEAKFGIDVVVPGMLIARVVRSPIIGGKVKRFDAKAAKKIPGVRAVVEIPSGVAVAADHFWAAKKGSEALSIEWDEGDNGALSDATITRELSRRVKEGVEARKVGFSRPSAAGARKLEATYQVPYLAHATMEPLNCTADVRRDRCEVWAPTQAQSMSLAAIAEITGLPQDQIVLHTTYLGGGFGRKAQTDFVKEAVHVSKAVKKPVKVIWTREDDMRGGWYRPAAYHELSGALDAQGWPDTWVHQIASPAILEAFGPLQGGIDRTSVEGAANLPYAIPNLRVTYAKTDLPLSVWFWRSVGSSINAFVTECFLDELAALGGKDPLEVRRRLLSGHPRHRRVLDVAAEKAGWGKALPKGRARGLAVHESFGSIVAEVAEVSLGEGGLPRVHRVVCAVDCGDVVNPSTVVAQMESAIVYGLSAALYGALHVDKGRVQEGNFDRYPVLRLADMPAIETHLVTSGDPMGGIGEPGTPPIAPAVANAVFALTRKPVRRLPFTIA